MEGGVYAIARLENKFNFSDRSLPNFLEHKTELQVNLSICHKMIQSIVDIFIEEKMQTNYFFKYCSKIYSSIIRCHSEKVNFRKDLGF